MTKKNCLKVLVMLGLALLAICIFNPNTVNATEITQEEIQEMIDLIPKNMDINLLEVEYDEAENIVQEEINKIFTSNNIDTKDINIGVSVIDYLGIEEFRKATVSFYVVNTDNTTTRLGETSISLKYSNTDKYNSNDEEYAKRLVIPKIEYHLLDIKQWEKEDIWEEAFKKAGENYTKLVNDPSIEIKCTSGSGDTNGPFTLVAGHTGNMNLLVFKDGILYDERITYPGLFLAELTVPSNISDNKIDEYIKNTIQGYVPDNIITVEKGTEEGYENGYTITYSYNDINVSTPMIIKREVSNIDIVDNTTNIKLEADTTVVPEDTKIVVNRIENGSTYETVEKILKDIVSKMYVYDITLKSNNAEIQPNGKVKISIPIPKDYNKANLVVYRIDENGTKTEYAVKILDNYAVFETDHFSTYVLAEKANIEDNTQTETPQEEEKQDTTNEHIKDETPKTGSNDIATIVCSILSALSAVGIAIVKKF